MKHEDLCKLELLLDEYELYLFKKYNRSNGKQTNAEYVHKDVTQEIDEQEEHVA